MELSGFSKLNSKQRFQKLLDLGILDREDVHYLFNGGLADFRLAENFIENVIGYFQLPLGVATNFHIDGRDRLIPMAVEETSIVAAASKTAKWVRESGSLTTEIDGRWVIGQIQVLELDNFEDFEAKVARKKAQWIVMANRDVAAGLVRRGGGVQEIQCRRVVDVTGNWMAVLHVCLDPVDAMGANIVNQVVEYLKVPIEEATGGRVAMCILSNLVDTRLTRAKVVIWDVAPELGEGIEEASVFAEADPYRAATHNKGVLNGIDPILIATGNDWRAVEAGVHAYAARGGRYGPITSWRYRDKNLIGNFEAPIIVGTVGGVTRLHPTAKLCLKILGCSHSDDLSRICGAVGLVQNLGALKALKTVGIIQGHMRLHIRNLALGVGASDHEEPLLRRRLEEVLKLTKRLSLQQASEILKEIRGGNTASNPLDTSP